MQQEGKRVTLQLSVLVIDLMDEMLFVKLETYKTEEGFKGKVGLISPLLETDVKEPSAIQTLSLSEQGKYETRIWWTCHRIR